MSRTVNICMFISESNRIEGIMREPSRAELEITEWFLDIKPLTVAHIEQLVDVYEPGAKLRRKHGMDVIVGMHVPPRGGPGIEESLRQLLSAGLSPYATHLAYEHLHPFMDGNGRSGRALWLRQMGGDVPLGFLHTFYYQTLAAFQ